MSDRHELPTTDIRNTGDVRLLGLAGVSTEAKLPSEMSCRRFLLGAWLTRKQVTLGDRGTVGLWMGAKLLGNSTGVVFETVERHWGILADLDEVAVGNTHIATPFPAVIVQRLGKEERSFVAPFFVAGPDVGDA
jgi:hypothetical protein